MSALQAVIDALTGGLTQGSRLLRLHTPLGANVLLAERATVVEGVGPLPPLPPAHHGSGVGAGLVDDADAWMTSTPGLRIEVQALSTDGHLELKRLIGQPALLELLTQQSPVPRPWHAHVASVRFDGSDGGLARYRLLLEPWLGFLAHRTDAWVFQDMTVMQIIDEVFADYTQHGKLAARWRWDLADPAAYPQRSLCIQYQETDLDFVHRLMLEEGLFYWFEHTADASDAGLGTHTLVIADHNAAFSTNPQPVVRYTQSDTTFPEDSLVELRQQRRLLPVNLQLASRDYRATALRPVQHTTALALGQAPADLAIADVPGQYAYEDTAQGERLAQRQMQALDSLRCRAQARGPWRTSAAGSTFVLRDHPVHTGLNPEQDRFAIVSAVHRARNNLAADARAAVLSLAAAVQLDQNGRTDRSGDDTPLHDARLVLVPANQPYRACAALATAAAGRSAAHASLQDGALPDPRLHRRPTVHGAQTALVVGDGGPVHTDRDHRVKVQFHWQRGASSSHRLAAASGNNAPANSASGTWVRSAARTAGHNWGHVNPPRVGQEVLVGFTNGDIDRPVILGAVYNARGNLNGQGSAVAGGAAGASANTPVWFEGSARQGALQAHAHTQVLNGIKSQELAASATGNAGHNQLVFDDSPGAVRLELSSTTANTRLQLGALLHQDDNRRLNLRGHGFDLQTKAHGALRAGSGLLVSAHSRPGSTGMAQQMDAREPHQQLTTGRELLHTLAESAQKHQAKGQHEPNLVGAKPQDHAKRLPNEAALDNLADSLQTTDVRGSSQTGDAETTGGGQGRVAAWARPDITLAAPQAIASFTPASHVEAAGTTTTITAGQDIQRLSLRHSSLAVKGDITLYTYGRASDKKRPVQTTGISLHAASGSVHSASLMAATHMAADKAVQVASTHAMVRVTAPKHVLLTAAGAALEITKGRITLKGPGKVEFRAGMKELAGGGSASASLVLPSSTLVMPEKFSARLDVHDLFLPQPFNCVRYVAKLDDGRFVSGILDQHGRTKQLYAAETHEMTVLIGESKSKWDLIVDYDDE